ncbi:MAG: hypothetical protein ABEJ27_08280 [Halodesulfurarchaeum sp.]
MKVWRSDVRSIVASLATRTVDGIERVNRATPFWLSIPLKAEGGLLIALIPLLVLAQDPRVSTLGIFEYLASWTIIVMAIVAAVSVVIGTVLTARKGIATLKSVLASVYSGWNRSSAGSTI